MGDRVTTFGATACGKRSRSAIGPIVLALLSVLLLTVPSAPAQSPGRPNASDLPGSVVLGAGIAVCERNRPVVSRVVLVPDADTYLQEVARWSPLGQWPVLFENDPRAAAFIRAFRPEEILVVPKTDRRLPPDSEIRDLVIAGAAKVAWGARELGIDWKRIYDPIGWVPPGLVVTSSSDPAWTAAVALSAGRGLPLAFIDDALGPVDGEMSEVGVRALAREIEKAAAATGYAWKGLGDELDAVAICRSMPGRCRFSPPPGVTVRIPNRPKNEGPFATTDVLCRGDNGERWGYAGWIWGDEARAASMAMSSLFLERRNVWIVSGYPDKGGWAEYAVEEAATELAQAGYASMSFEGERASIEEWRRLTMGAIPPDILYLNSHGNPREFHLHEDARAVPQDFPFAERPMVLGMVHSFALQRPNDPTTVGGRALQRGVYAYIGSVDEPYLAAFVPPLLQTRRIRAGVPVLLAGRWWPGEGAMSGIWKITTIGDPFMLAPPPGTVPRRIVPLTEAPSIPAGRPLVDRAQELMAEIAETPDRAGDAVDLLVLLDRDQLAIDLWENLMQEGSAVAIAAASSRIIDPLFRARKWRELVRAYRRIPAELRDDDARDMLWHLLAPRLSGIQSRETILLLRSQIREPQVEEDLRLLMPHLDRVLGAGAGRAEVRRRLAEERDEARRARLERLL
ncbi:MAG: hypothetical protein VX672_01505 [Planctomycetota bacterium]|nr:hypothetical protein [Planctomycetota bacterium]